MTNYAVLQHGVLFDDCEIADYAVFQCNSEIKSRLKIRKSTDKFAYSLLTDDHIIHDEAVADPGLLFH